MCQRRNRRRGRKHMSCWCRCTSRRFRCKRAFHPRIVESTLRRHRRSIRQWHSPDRLDRSSGCRRTFARSRCRLGLGTCTLGCMPRSGLRQDERAHRRRRRTRPALPHPLALLLRQVRGPRPGRSRRRSWLHSHRRPTKPHQGPPAQRRSTPWHQMVSEATPRRPPASPRGPKRLIAAIPLREAIPARMSIAARP